MDALNKAVDAARNNGISTIVIASTTGNTAHRLLEIIKPEKLKVIVVTHDEGRLPQDRKFDDTIRDNLEANDFKIYTHNPRYILLRKIIGKIFGRFGFPRWYRRLKEIKAKYGTGIKVCHIIVQMLMEGGVLKNEKVVAIAGMKSGADSAAIFMVKPRSKWPILEKVIINQQ